MRNVVAPPLAATIDADDTSTPQRSSTARSASMCADGTSWRVNTTASLATRLQPSASSPLLLAQQPK
jgi:hypothetical protein